MIAFIGLVAFLFLIFENLDKKKARKNNPFHDLPKIIEVEKEKIILKDKIVYVNPNTGNKLSNIQDVEFEEIKD